jgi:hypothetical protein
MPMADFATAVSEELKQGEVIDATAGGWYNASTAL